MTRYATPKLPSPRMPCEDNMLVLMLIIMMVVMVTVDMVVIMIMRLT